MGTNYYLYMDVCKHCKRPARIMHIGKSSAGWCFSLHVRDPQNVFEEHLPNSFEEWEELFSDLNNVIYDEYGNEISAERLVMTITQRSWPNPHEHTPAWLAENHAVLGPNGLCRHAILAGHCIGHAPNNETYDLIIGEFS